MKAGIYLICQPYFVIFTAVMIKEACVETFEEAVSAAKKGADRIELCADLQLDGLTPSFELMQRTCSTLKIPVMVMIRPRGGGFVYSEEEINQMKTDIDKAKKAGVVAAQFAGNGGEVEKVRVHNLPQFGVAEATFSPVNNQYGFNLSVAEAFG